MTNLQALYVGTFQFANPGLYREGTQITDARLEHLKGLTNLQKLRLENSQVTDAGVKKLQQALPTCEITH